MADPKDLNEKNTLKSSHAEREEAILAYWNEKEIFKKTLEKNADSGREFVFYEGPPTANGLPGIHHLEARAFKDAIPRYKTMQGFYVRRKGGWDTHGLPVELQVEKELGLKSKKEIEIYGIEKFNQKCKQSVWKYVNEWEKFTNRIAYWVDLQNPYITYQPSYIESLWHIIHKVDKDRLLYKDYKVVPWCPRCGTGLSSHELAQGYKDVKDLSVFVKFKIKNQDNNFLLAWTTTPWTLPGNTALAIGENLDYVQVKTGSESLILAKSRLSIIKESYQIEKEFKGAELVGLEYEPLYDFIKKNVTGSEKEKLTKAFKVYSADFVNTQDGTGIVHIAPMYGQDDFELGTKVGLPKYHLVNDDGTFKPEAEFLAGKFVKDEAMAVDIIKDLANRPSGSLLFHKEKHEHSYPHCWRCQTPLIYFARDSWYIRMSDLRHKLVKENEEINWQPSHIKEGRFGEWLREVKDWAISRERYWGTPLPVWICELCKEKKVVGSVADIVGKPKNNYWVMRHGEAESNVTFILNSDRSVVNHLTPKGQEHARKNAEALKDKKIDFIIASPFMRTQETAAIAADVLGLQKSDIITENNIREMSMGVWEGKNGDDFMKAVPLDLRMTNGPEGGENYRDIKKRMGDFLYDCEQKYQGKNILVVTHGSPAMMLMAAAKGLDDDQSIEIEKSAYIHKAEIRPLDFKILPHNEVYELDLHRPYVDEITLSCSCGGSMKRVKEVMDVWFDSGAMPFAQDHYPFQNKNNIDGGLIKKAKNYPADFISEAIDQTRGWFYTLHAIGILMGKGKAYKNVICLGHILDAEGKKMSKSLGNVINPWDMMNKYGADALRFWMYSVNQPGESKNFDEKTVDEVVKKVFNLITNILSFYKMYAGSLNANLEKSENVLDNWMISKLNKLNSDVSKGLDSYNLIEPSRFIRDFVADFSQWYIRRSRDRFKDQDENAIITTRFVLINLAKIMAPFTPFFADFMYKEVGGEKESVHLEDWPKLSTVDDKLLKDMEKVRAVASLGLEARMKAKINVRQPLASLKVREMKIDRELIKLIEDEVNVKNVIEDASISEAVYLDTTITPDLKEEGDVRELIRRIQDARKEKNLSISDSAILTLPETSKDLALKYQAEIKKNTGLSSIEFGSEFNVRT